jgi:hypothetical protein
MPYRLMDENPYKAPTRGILWTGLQLIWLAVGVYIACLIVQEEVLAARLLYPHARKRPTTDEYTGLTRLDRMAPAMYRSLAMGHYEIRPLRQWMRA